MTLKEKKIKFLSKQLAVLQKRKTNLLTKATERMAAKVATIDEDIHFIEAELAQLEGVSE